MSQLCSELRPSLVAALIMECKYSRAVCTDLFWLKKCDIAVCYLGNRAWGSVVVKAHATSLTVPGSIPGGFTGDFFRGTAGRTMCSEVDSASESEYKGFLLG